MDIHSALIAFSVAAWLLTLTPGLDTALVLRTAAVEGGRQAMLAGSGIAAGCLAWGLAASLGLGAVLAVSETAYALLRLAGAAYLLWLGLAVLRSAWRGTARMQEPSLPPPSDGKGGRWFWRGLLTNLLNPKVGVFYVSFLPQFMVAGVSVVGFSMLLASLHAAMGLAWFAALTLATRPLGQWLRRPSVTRTLDSMTGAVLIAFGVKLALDRR